MRSLAGVFAAAVMLAASNAHAAPVPCVGGMAGIYPCNNVDLMVQMPLSAIGGGSGNDVWGWTDSTTGKEYAIIGLSNGTSFVDISDPENPVFLGRLPAPPTGACVPSLAPAPVQTKFEPFVPDAPDHDECQSPLPDQTLLPYVGFGPDAPDHCGSDSAWRDHEVLDDHVFIGSEQGGHGLVVFNLATLRNVPTPPVLFAQTARYCGFGNSHTITVNPNRPYVFANGTSAAPCVGGRPHIVDVSTPGLPVFVGCDSSGVNPNPYTHDSQCFDYNGPDVAHQGKAICVKSNGSQTNANNRLVISDVTNPAAPVLISSTGYPGAGYTHQGWITHDHRHFLLDDELDETDFGHNTRTYIWNFTDLDAPVLMGFHEHATPAIDHQQFVHSNYVYQSNYRAGLRILETQNVPSGQLSEVGFFDVYPANDNASFNGTWANYPFYRSGIVAVSTIETASPGGFFLLRPRFADLAVTVTDAPDPVVVGQDVTYTFTVRNQGPTWSTDTTLTDALPPSVTLVSATPSQGACTGTTTVACNLGTLHNGDVETVVIVVRANVPGVLANSGVASAVETDTRAADNTATAQTTVTQAAQAAEPSGLAVDAGGNRVLQPNEGPVVVAPSWRNIGTGAITLSGAAAGFAGPAGPTYTTVDGAGAYPTLSPGGSTPCSDCYSFSITAGARPATHWDSTFQETVNPSGTAKTWTLHVGNSFGDVPASSPFFRFVETMLHRGVTGGCTTSAFCPTSSTSRDQMAVFALVSKEGPSYVPPACGAPMFTDVPAASPFCRWVEELARRGVVGGCGGGRYCPAQAVNREQMALFALKTLEGPAYVPNACGAPMFGDVPATSPFCRWIEELARRGVVAGCGGGNYCPATPVSREQMSVFLTATFGLQLYGL
jgi:choice-of-anchor B domain-containing protein